MGLPQEDPPSYKPVYVIGAGSSQMAGMPLLTNFMKTARELRYSRSLNIQTSIHFDRVFDYQRELSKSRLVTGTDLDDLETLFSVLDMEWQVAEAKRTSIPRDPLFTLIIQTLKSSAINSAEYSKFITQLARPHNSTFITFNYDLCIERALAGVPLDQPEEGTETRATYGAGEMHFPTITHKQTRQVLKLHGSANWVWCHDCGNVVPFGDYVPTIDSSIGFPHKKKNCEPPLLNLILPPTWNKTNYATAITDIWSKSVQELSLATHIFVIGYSFPRTDVFFKQMFTLAMRSNKTLKQVYIINPDHNLVTELLPKLFDRHFLGRSVKFYPITLGVLSKEFEDYLQRNNVHLEDTKGLEEIMNFIYAKSHE